MDRAGEAGAGFRLERGLGLSAVAVALCALRSRAPGRGGGATRKIQAHRDFPWRYSLRPIAFRFQSPLTLHVGRIVGIGNCQIRQLHRGHSYPRLVPPLPLDFGALGLGVLGVVVGRIGAGAGGRV